MYFKKIEIENTGPIENLKIDLPFNALGNPKPMVIVGENGGGKTILLSNLVNALMVGRQAVFEDAEIEQGKLYKYRSPSYIKSGTHYSYSRVEFDNSCYVEEWQLDTPKEKFEENYQFVPARVSWAHIPNNEHSTFTSTFLENDKSAAKIFENRCCLYFPVNRFEEPAWLNSSSLKEKVTYTELKHIQKHSNRQLISTSPLKANRSWLLDLLFDRQLFELKKEVINVPMAGNGKIINLLAFGGFEGQSSVIYEAVLKVFHETLKTNEAIRLGVGTRHHRQISVIKNETAWIPDIFQLSTGEVLLLNLFLSIVRDFDLSGGKIKNIEDIEGIVVVDEIDSHLHTRHQKEILPSLIASFPKVQFIVTTHSPLFVLGMEEKLGVDNFRVINMPDGNMVAASDFSEFNAAYEAFKKTNRHRNEISEALRINSKPILFVEGDYDIKYIRKAAEFLNKSNLLELIQIKDGSGFGNLDKVWRCYETQLSEILPVKILLLYDCDTNKSASEKGNLVKRVIPSMAENPISVGIENLIPSDLIEKLELIHPHFIDVEVASSKRIRGKETVVPAKKSANKDEKKNLCNWICDNADANDFRNFSKVFDIIEDILIN